MPQDTNANETDAPPTTTIKQADDLGTVVGAKTDSSKYEVSAATVVRMLGLPSTSEFKVVEGKIDLIAGKLNNMMVRVEKIGTQVAAAPTGQDLDRIDAQIASLRGLIKDLVERATENDIRTKARLAKEAAASEKTSPAAATPAATSSEKPNE